MARVKNRGRLSRPPRRDDATVQSPGYDDRHSGDDAFPFTRRGGDAMTDDHLLLEHELKALLDSAGLTKRQAGAVAARLGFDGA